MRIEHRNLARGTVVWYRYADSEYPASGPFTVVDFFNDHEGKHVTLAARGETRNVCLADDDDYGEPIFYDSDPATQ